MSALCGPGCGWCGRCTAAWERTDNDFEDEQGDEMAKLNEIYGGNYMKAEDIKDRGDLNATIEKVSIVAMEDGKKKAVLHFRGSQKTLPLNVTNANMVEELLGSNDTDDWEGQRICLYTCKVDFQGKRVLAIRIKAARSGKAAAKPTPPPPPPQEDDLDGDLDGDLGDDMAGEDAPF